MKKIQKNHIFFVTFLDFFHYARIFIYMRPLRITQSITNVETESFKRYLSEVSKNAQITQSDEQKLAKLISIGDEKALDRLVQANLRFVISVAKQYVRKGVDLEDLVNEGNIGLIKAAQKFDPDRGIKFISYAVWWIRQSITQSLANNSRTIRLPINQIKQLNKIKEAEVNLINQLQRPATPLELANYLGIDEDKVKLSLLNSHKTSSFDSPIGEDNLTLLDTFSSTNRTDDLINKNDLRDSINRSLSILKSKERLVIESVFGINREIKTFNEIAIELGICPERVRQIKRTALKKMNEKTKKGHS